MDLDLRKLRYFVAVAECAGFRRAAEQLHVAQPALTRQIKSFEGDLRATLFSRSVRGTELTEAGRQLLKDARPLLRTADSLRERLELAQAASPRITIGIAEDVAIPTLISDFAREHPAVAVDFVTTPKPRQAQLALAGQVDACFARAPLVGEGLTVVPLFEEPQVAVMPDDLPLARLDRLSIEDLRGMTLIGDSRGSTGLGVPGTTPPSDSDTDPHASDAVLRVGDEVAARRGVAILPESIAARLSRPGVTFRYVQGLAGSTVVLGYVKESSSRYVHAIVHAALVSAA